MGDGEDHGLTFFFEREFFLFLGINGFAEEVEAPDEAAEEAVLVFFETFLEAAFGELDGQVLHFAERHEDLSPDVEVLAEDVEEQDCE